MHNLKQQTGMATILVVLLLGMTVMLLTAMVAKSIVSKKEAGVAAHAQTNAELMGWAGVSAFREYLLAQGRLGANHLIALNGMSEIDLKPDPTLKKQILAKNIQVRGCTVEGAECIVSADVSAANHTSHAATTIHAIYSLALSGGTATIVDKEIKASLGGNVLFTGNTIKAEEPNSKVTLNVDGSVTINADFKLENISQLNINAKGNVDINCVAVDCASFQNVNINAKGWVNIHEGLISKPANLGNINAERKVTLQTYVNAKNINSMNDVYIATESSAQNVTAIGDVTLFDRSSAQNILSNGNVKLTNSTANNIDVGGYVYLEVDATVNGNINAKGNDKYLDYVVYVLSGAEVKGTIYAKGDVRILATAKAKDIYATGDIDGIGSTGRMNKQQNISTLPSLNFAAVNGTDIYNIINGYMDFGTRVDVTKYKNDANYIFLSSHGFGRVILNKLKNPTSGDTYIYENGVQKVIANGASTAQVVGDGKGFFIGDYDLKDGSGWLPTTGAICQTLSSRMCSSNIVGYLPRLNIQRVGIVSEDYSYATNIWYLRSTSDKSSLDNAAFAPGIFYFDGRVDISGHTSALQVSTAFTNTILAEGEISISANSPRIYSPYNILREKTNAEVICNRTLKTSNSTTTYNTPPNTTPTTLSNKYLIPTNLCNNATEFAYSMDRNSSTGEKLKVNIDGINVDKIDLGYVALMSNKFIDPGSCTLIYGDIYARDVVRFSNLPTCDDKDSIKGNISTQGDNGQGTGNTFGTGMTYVIPKENHTGVREETTTTTNTGLKAESSSLKWAKYE